MRKKLEKMYKCMECGAEFREAKQFKETIGEHYGREVEEYGSCCPICGGDFEESALCIGCGQYYIQDELTAGFCKNCGNQLIKQFDRLLHTHFLTDQILFLSEAYSGKEF